MTKKRFRVVLEVAHTEQDVYEVQLHSIDVCDRTTITATEIKSTERLCDEFAKSLTDSMRNQLEQESDMGFA